jgi:hypothetical protein
VQLAQIEVDQDTQENQDPIPPQQEPHPMEPRRLQRDLAPVGAYAYKTGRTTTLVRHRRKRNKKSGQTEPTEIFQGGDLDDEVQIIPLIDLTGSDVFFQISYWDFWLTFSLQELMVNNLRRQETVLRDQTGQAIILVTDDPSTSSEVYILRGILSLVFNI